MKRSTLLNIVALLFAVLLVSCNQEKTVIIDGTITNANGEKLFLEHLAGGAPVMVDTLVLDEKGQFKFRTVTQPGGPDFFSLRISTQSIPLVTDTLGTPVHVTADFQNFSNGYTVDDPTNQRLKEAAQLCNDLRRSVIDAATSFSKGEMGEQTYRQYVMDKVSEYKNQVLDKYIYNNPADPVSYYVLFESVRGLSIFDPYDPEDNRAYGAVATSWLFSYANSPRVAILEKVTKEGQMLRRRALAQAQASDSLSTTIKQTTYFDLVMPDKHDKMTSLSELVEAGHVVVLDFTAYFLQTSVAHNLMLSELYKKYADRGLRIYQVCLDFDENFWKVSADNVPWTAVHDTEVLFDEQGNIQYSRAAATYNVGQLPTSYILDREGNLKVRVENEDKLEGELVKLL